MLMLIGEPTCTIEKKMSLMKDIEEAFHAKGFKRCNYSVHHNSVNLVNETSGSHFHVVLFIVFLSNVVNSFCRFHHTE